MMLASPPGHNHCRQASHLYLNACAIREERNEDPGLSKVRHTVIMSLQFDVYLAVPCIYHSVVPSTPSAMVVHWFAMVYGRVPAVL